MPEVPVRVSYKGNKEKNLRDIRDFSLVIPTLEYHNVTWTWLDLFLAMKNDSRRVILSQVSIHVHFYAVCLNGRNIRWCFVSNLGNKAKVTN